MKPELFNWGGFPGDYLPNGTMPDVRKLEKVAAAMKSDRCFGVHVHPTLNRADFLFAQPLGDLGIELEPHNWQRLVNLQPCFIGFAPRHPDIIATMQPLSLIWDRAVTKEYGDAERRKRHRERAWDEIFPKRTLKQLTGEVDSPPALPQNRSDDDQSVSEGELVEEPVQHIDGHILECESYESAAGTVTVEVRELGEYVHPSIISGTIGSTDRADREPPGSGGEPGRRGGCEETSAETGGAEDSA